MQEHPADTARRWFEQAENDLAVAGENADNERFNIACFLCQQAAEKAIKALLIWRSGDFPRTHAIDDLLRELATHDAENARRLSGARSLEPFYAPTRYPDALAGGLPARAYGRPEADLATRSAADALEVVRSALGT